MKNILFVVLFIAIIASAFATVHELKASEFDSHIKSKDLSFVKFYAPWCGHCKRMAPVLEEASTKLQSHIEASLKQPVPEVSIAKVDCTDADNKSLCKKYGVRGYPTVLLFSKDGEHYEFKGQRNTAAILNSITSHFRDKFEIITTKDDLAKFISAPNPDINSRFVIYTSGGVDGAVVKAVKAASDRIPLDFVTLAVYPNQAGAEKVEAYRLGEASPLSIPLPPDADASAIVNIVKNNQVPILGRANSDQYRHFGAKKLPIVAFVVNKATPSSTVDNLRPLATKYSDKLTFVEINRDVWSKFPTQFSLNDTGIVIDDITSKKKYVPPSQDITDVNAAEQFIQSFLEGTLEPFFRSQPLPEPDNNAVVTVVGHNYDEVVLDKERDALVLFHAPWCGHCKKVKPIYEDLAKAFQNDSNIVIAHVDATANDFNGPRITGYPSIYFFPQGSKSNPIKYSGARTVKDFTNFIKKHRKTSPNTDAKPRRDEL